MLIVKYSVGDFDGSACDSYCANEAATSTIIVVVLTVCLCVC